MTAPQEPLKLTFEEFLAELVRRGWEYKFDGRAFLRHRVLNPAEVSS